MNPCQRLPQYLGWIICWGLFCALLATRMAEAREKPEKIVKIPSGFFVPLYRPSEADKKNRPEPQKIPVKSFWLDSHPVTNADYLAFVKKNPAWQRSQVPRLFAEENYLKHWQSDTRLGKQAPLESPVVNISWFAAKAYCEAQGKKLPSVNQWEYVAQADELSPDAASDQKFINRILEWYSKPNPEILPQVSSNFKNLYGVHDMHGLIWEWILDFNTALVTGESRADTALERDLYCGAGSIGASNFHDYAAFMRYGFRSSLKADYVVGHLGFRCAK